MNIRYNDTKSYLIVLKLAFSLKCSRARPSLRKSSSNFLYGLLERLLFPVSECILMMLANPPPSEPAEMKNEIFKDKLRLATK